MPVQLNPYLSFRDNARQAMEFYHSVLGGELTLSTFAELQASEDPAERDKIMHGKIETENGLVLMGADTPNSMEYTPGAGFSVSLSGDDDTQLRSYWDALSDGGTITLPLETAPWGDSFGMHRQVRRQLDGQHLWRTTVVSAALIHPRSRLQLGGGAD